MKQVIEKLSFAAFKRWCREYRWDCAEVTDKGVDSAWRDLCAEAEKREKKKALAYSDKEGLIFHVVVGSEEHNAVEKDSDYQRLECFDIESGE
jgi:hypothetical protein